MDKQFELWCQRRLAELSAPDSWLGLVGLFWLEPGSNTVGADDACAVRLPEGPARLGVLEWQGDSITWRPQVGDALKLLTDAAGEPSRVTCGKLVFFVIEREGRPAVRLRDLGWREKRPFAGVGCFPFDRAWCIDAEWQERVPPLELQIQTMTGDLKTVAVRHRAEFKLGNRVFSLLPMEEGADGAFFVFRDQTAGRETYGGGRFLRTEAARNGRILLDFNRAYNPPCAFTPFAACPLPPAENRLALAVTAGEKRYGGKH